jgi:hypothetical protein
MFKKKPVFSTTVCYILSPNASDPMAYWDRHLYNIESPFNKESSYQIQLHCNSWVYGILFLNYCVLLNLWFWPNGSYPINPLVFICAYFKICISQWIFMHMEYISLLIRYSRACGFCQDFRDRGLLLTRKLLNQGLLLVSWNYHFESFTVAIMTRLIAMEYLRHKWPRICSTCRKHFPVLSSFMTYHRVCN